MAVHERWMESPIGRLRLFGEAGALVALHMEEHRHGPALAVERRGREPVLGEAEAQLTAWFAGERTSFDVPIRLKGTRFQLAVWSALRAIPFGETRSYSEIAAAVGQPEAVRAVGAANGRNPIAIVVPCHRVIGANGTLTGYGGGLPRKRWLLEHEQAVLARAGRSSTRGQVRLPFVAPRSA
jgi:methylated-DNA-[protein]-cysteine S-methyltransferase